MDTSLIDSITAARERLTAARAHYNNPNLANSRVDQEGAMMETIDDLINALKIVVNNAFKHTPQIDEECKHAEDAAYLIIADANATANDMHQTRGDFL